MRGDAGWAKKTAKGKHVNRPWAAAGKAINGNDAQETPGKLDKEKRNPASS